MIEKVWLPLKYVMCKVIINSHRNTWCKVVISTVATVWLPLSEAFIKVWLPCGYAWLAILNPYRKSVATRVIKKKNFKQVTIQILHLSLSYIKCGYRVATIVGGLY